MELTQLLSWAALKNLTYVVVFIATVEWLGFNSQSLAILMTIMTIDIITGIVRVASVDGCHSIRSRIGIKGLFSKILLLTGLLTFALALKGVGFDPKLMAQGVVNVFILAEAYSVIGNIHSARTKKPKVEFDAVSHLLNVVRKLLDKVVKQDE